MLLNVRVNPIYLLTRSGGWSSRLRPTHIVPKILPEGGRPTPQLRDTTRVNPNTTSLRVTRRLDLKAATERRDALRRMEDQYLSILAFKTYSFVYSGIVHAGQYYSWH